MSFGGLIRRSLYWANDWLHGSPVRRQYDELSKTMNSYYDGKAIQSKKLDRILHYAVKECRYFADYNPKDLKSFPVTNKSVMIENASDILVDPEKVPGQKGPFHYQKTSGSTGVPFEVAQDTQKRARRVAELKWFNTMSGFKSHERLGQCRIWTKWQSKSRWQSFRENILPFNVSSMNEKTLSNLCNTVEKHHLVSLRAYASWYTELARYLKNNPNEIEKLNSLKVCFSSSEALEEPTREYFENIVGCSMIEAYANEENGILAQQIVGSLDFILNHSGYYFELLRFDSDLPVQNGEIGRIVITDLHNYAYPFIRYDTGDTGIFVAEEGSWPKLLKLYGRKIDLVYNTDGTPIHPMVFARILKNVEGIKQWQFIQKGRCWYELRINKIDTFDEKICKSEILPLLGKNAILNIVYVDEIPVLASGKRRSVLCEWSGE